MNAMERAEAIGITGFLHCAELEQLIDLACGKDVLEIGSYRGLSAWGMAQTARSLFCVDTFRACTNGQRQESSLQTLDAFLHAVSRFKNVRYFVGTSEQAHVNAHPIEGNTELGAFDPHGQFDMIFIDAMHDYENVKSDINRWWPRVRSGGILVGHDYRHKDFPGVEKAFDEIFGPAPEGTNLITLRWIKKP